MARYHVTGISDGEFTSTGRAGVFAFALGLAAGVICSVLYMNTLADGPSVGSRSMLGFLGFCAVAGWVVVLISFVMMLVGRGYRYDIIATELPDDQAD